MIRNYKTQNNIYVTFDEPDICPICSHSISPILLSTRFHSFTEEEFILFNAFFECPFCKKSFITAYSLAFSRQNISDYYYHSVKTLYSSPSYFEAQEFPECIDKNYSSFVKIYNQSLEAEHHKLNEIAGIGYRKALEFLIKDFLILHENKDETKVKSTALGNCISTMIDNPQLKIVASRATWLGNDQTHYEQKYTDKDINDLKRLIKLSVNWIEIIYLTDEAEQIEKK